jgi:hypothetical protein
MAHSRIRRSSFKEIQADWQLRERVCKLEAQMDEVRKAIFELDQPLCEVQDPFCVPGPIPPAGPSPPPLVSPPPLSVSPSPLDPIALEPFAESPPPPPTVSPVDVQNFTVGSGGRVFCVNPGTDHSGQLRSLLVSELKDLAQQLEVPVPRGANKASIVRVLNATLDSNSDMSGADQ